MKKMPHVTPRLPVTPETEPPSPEHDPDIDTEGDEFPTLLTKNDQREKRRSKELSRKRHLNEFE